VWHLCTVEAGYDGNAVSSNYMQGGPSYNSQAGNRGGDAYVTYDTSHKTDHTRFTI